MIDWNQDSPQLGLSRFQTDEALGEFRYKQGHDSGPSGELLDHRIVQPACQLVPLVRGLLPASRLGWIKETEP